MLNTVTTLHEEPTYRNSLTNNELSVSNSSIVNKDDKTSSYDTMYSESNLNDKIMYSNNKGDTPKTFTHSSQSPLPVSSGNVSSGNDICANCTCKIISSDPFISCIQCSLLFHSKCVNIDSLSNGTLLV